MDNSFKQFWNFVQKNFFCPHNWRIKLWAMLPIFSVPFEIMSLLKWYLISICSILSWNMEFLLKCIALRLWENNIALSSTKASSLHKSHNLIPSLKALEATLYSTLVEDKATTFWSWDFQLITVPQKVMKYDDVDFLLSLSPAKSKSA